MPDLFKDRRDAGRRLAADLQAWKGQRPVVLALPRGGVPVAFEIAQTLEAPLAVFVVRKLGVPGHRELAMGALASGGSRVLNEDVVKSLGISERAIEDVAAEESRELARREVLYGAGQTPLDLRDRTVIVVDDGLATGSTMRAAVQAVRAQRPARVIVAAPVGARSTCEALGREADEVVCLRRPEPFSAVGLWYARFDQTTDEEVRTLLEAARAASHPSGGRGRASPTGGVDVD